MKRFLGLFLVLLLVTGWLAGCASAESEVSPLTTTSTSAPETAPDVVSDKVKDIETIMGTAERLGIKVTAITHAGSSITFNCEAKDYTIFRDYLVALEESGRFSSVSRPPEQYSYVKSGTIQLKPKYQYIDMPAVYYEANRALAPIKDSDAIAMLVGIARESGIDVSAAGGKFIVLPVTFGQADVGGGKYRLLSFNGIHVQGEYDKVMAFISDLNSHKTLKNMVLTGVTISPTEIMITSENITRNRIEAIATVGVDIYTIES